MKRQALATIALVLFGATIAPHARAALDPDRAETHVNEALRDGQYAFCKNPPRLRGERAEKMCPIARDIPGCDGLVRACADPKAPELSEPTVGPVVATLAQIGVWLLVLGAFAAIAFPIVQAIRRAWKDRALADPIVPEEPAKATESAPEEAETVTDAERLLRRAEEHTRRGDLDKALFAYLGASLRALDQRGAIRIARHRTHGEYVRSCTEGDARAKLREIVREVDRVQFGRQTPSPEKVAGVASRAVSLVRVTALLSVALLATGCGERLRLPVGADPAGTELMTDVLRRQGMKVSRLGGSLATLPMPKSAGLAPIVIVDAETTTLEDDTRAHLRLWVESGGLLVLAGHPSAWPKELDAHGHDAAARELVVTLAPLEASEDDEEEPSPRKFEGAKVARADALSWPSATPSGKLGDGAVYAATKSLGKGAVLGLANDDLLTNASFARPKNAAAFTALLVALTASHEVTGDELGTGEREIKIARSEDGVSPPSNPVSGMIRAGLGKGLLHALVAALVLFVAVGARHARPKPVPGSARRAFAEHVQATGAFYARTRAAPHALHTFAKFADERLRAKMPRGMTDAAAFLALRAGADPERCAKLLERAARARDDEVAKGDELGILKELRSLLSAANKAD